MQNSVKRFVSLFTCKDCWIWIVCIITSTCVLQKGLGLGRSVCGLGHSWKITKLSLCSLLHWTELYTFKNWVWRCQDYPPLHPNQRKVSQAYKVSPLTQYALPGPHQQYTTPGRLPLLKATKSDLCKLFSQACLGSAIQGSTYFLKNISCWLEKARSNSTQ